MCAVSVAVCVVLSDTVFPPESFAEKASSIGMAGSPLQLITFPAGSKLINTLPTACAYSHACGAALRIHRFDI
eukprot:2422608-Prymnesium_polylepis.2